MQVRDERVDGMITKLLEVRGKKPGKNVQLSEDDIKHLCTKSRELFISQPNLLELEAPIKICGKSILQRHLLPILSCHGRQISVISAPADNW
jgi:hypothetical protein